MLRKLQRLPASFFLLNHYTYLIVVALSMIGIFAVVAANGFPPIGIAVLLTVAVLYILIWYRFSPRGTADLPTDADAILKEIKRSRKYALIAFESEYCPACMIMEPRVISLEENSPDLKVYRVLIQREPGRTLFKRYDLRMTPSYVLLDSNGKVVMDWLLGLPLERIRYMVKQQLQAS